MDNDIISLPRLNLKNRALHDLEVMLVGGFDPVWGFMDEADYNSVVENMRLADGRLFPIPIVLDVDPGSPYQVGDDVLLCDPFGNPLAKMTITSRYSPDKSKEARGVYGTEDMLHPGVQYLFDEMSTVYLGGTIEKIALPRRHDFIQFRSTPEELKVVFKRVIRCIVHTLSS